MNDENNLTKQLSSLIDKVSRMEKQYNDILSNIDDDCLSSSILNEKTKFTKLYNQFDVSNDGYTLNGSVKTECDNATGVSVDGRIIQIFAENPEYADIRIGYDNQNNPLIILGNDVKDDSGKTSGQLVFEKYNSEDENGAYARVRYIDKNGNSVYIKFAENSIEFFGGTLDFSNVEVKGVNTTATFG